MWWKPRVASWHFTTPNKLNPHAAFGYESLNPYLSLRKFVGLNSIRKFVNSLRALRLAGNRAQSLNEICFI